MRPYKLPQSSYLSNNSSAYKLTLRASELSFNQEFKGHSLWLWLLTKKKINPKKRIFLNFLRPMSYKSNKSTDFFFHRKKAPDVRVVWKRSAHHQDTYWGVPKQRSAGCPGCWMELRSYCGFILCYTMAQGQERHNELHGWFKKAKMNMSGSTQHIKQLALLLCTINITLS